MRKGGFAKLGLFIFQFSEGGKVERLSCSGWWNPAEDGQEDDAPAGAARI